MSGPTSDPASPAEQPEGWERDLRPEFLAGVNSGLKGPHEEKAVLTAAEIKELHQRLRDFSKEDLKQIVILPEGARLEQGATYIDLNDPARRPFTATADMRAGPENLYVPKSEVGYVLWNRLIGVQHRQRLDLADEP